MSHSPPWHGPNWIEPPPGAPDIVLRFRGVSEAQAQDVIWYHRYLYYVKSKPTLSDRDYDSLEWYLKWIFPHNKIIAGVGSDNLDDYPHYIIECRRPTQWERDYYHPKQSR